MSTKKALQEALASEASYPSDNARPPLLRAPNVSGGATNNYVEDTSLAGKQYMQLAKAIGDFGTEGVRNLSRGFYAEAENQVMAYEDLTEEQKRKHAENEDTLNEYYRKQGLFGINPVARVNIERQQGAAYASIASDDYDGVVEDMGRAINGQSISDERNVELLGKYGFSEGMNPADGALTTESIRKINEDVTNRFLQENEAALNSTYRREGLLRSLMSKHEKAIETLPATLDSLVEARSIAMAPKAIADAVRADLNNIPEKLEENLQPVFKTLANATPDKIDAVVKDLEGHFYKEVNGEMVFDAVNHRKALKALVGRLNYGNTKLSEENPAYLEALGRSYFLEEQQLQKEDRELKDKALKLGSPIINEYEKEVVALRNAGDFRGLLDLQQKFRDRIAEEFEGQPVLQRLILDELEGEFGEDISITNMVQAEQNREEQEQKAKETAENRIKTQKDSVTKELNRVGNAQISSRVSDPNFLMPLLAKAGVNPSLYFNVTEGIGMEKDSYKANSNVDALAIQLSAVLQGKAYEFASTGVDNGEGDQPILNQWQQGPLQDWMDNNLEDLIIGFAKEKNDLVFKDDEEALRLYNQIEDPQAAQQYIIDYNRGGRRRAEPNALKAIEAQNKAAEEELKVSITPEEDAQGRMLNVIPVLPLRGEGDNRAKGDKRFKLVRKHFPNATNESIIQNFDYYLDRWYEGKGASETSRLFKQLSTNRFENGRLLSSKDRQANVEQLKQWVLDYGAPAQFMLDTEWVDHAGNTQQPLPPYLQETLVQDAFAGDLFILGSVGNQSFRRTVNDKNYSYLNELASYIALNPEVVPQSAGKSYAEIKAQLIENQNKALGPSNLGLKDFGAIDEVSQAGGDVVDTITSDPMSEKEVDEVLPNLPSLLYRGAQETMEDDLSYNFESTSRGLFADTGFSMRGIAAAVGGTIDMIQLAGYANIQQREYNNLVNNLGYSPEDAQEMTDQLDDNFISVEGGLRTGLSSVTFWDITDPYYDEPDTWYQSAFMWLPEVAATMMSGGTSVLRRGAQEGLENLSMEAGVGPVKRFARKKALQTQKLVADKGVVATLGGAIGDSIGTEMGAEGFERVTNTMLGGVAAIVLTRGRTWRRPKLYLKLRGKSPYEIAQMVQNGKLSKQDVQDIMAIGKVSEQQAIKGQNLAYKQTQHIARRMNLGTKTGIDIDNASLEELREAILDNFSGDPKMREGFLNAAMYGGTRSDKLSYNDLLKFAEERGIDVRSLNVKHKGKILPTHHQLAAELKRHYYSLSPKQQKEFIENMDSYIGDLMKSRIVTPKQAETLADFNKKYYGIGEDGATLPKPSRADIIKDAKRMGVATVHPNGQAISTEDILADMYNKFQKLDVEQRSKFLGISDKPNDTTPPTDPSPNTPPPDDPTPPNTPDDTPPPPPPNSPNTPDDTPPPPKDRGTTEEPTPTDTGSGTKDSTPEPTTEPTKVPTEGTSKPVNTPKNQSENTRVQNENTTETPDVSGDSLFGQQVSSKKNPDKPNFKRDYEPTDSPSKRYTAKEMPVALRPSAKHHDTSRDARTIREGFPRITFDGIRSGEVTGITYNRGFNPKGSQFRWLSKQKKGDVIPIFKNGADPNSPFVWVEVQSVAVTPKGKGLSAMQIERYGKDDGLTPYFYQNRTSDNFPYIHIKFRKLDNQNFKTAEEAESYLRSSRKVTDADDVVFDISKVPLGKQAMTGTQFESLANRFKFANKIIGVPVQKGKNAKSTLGKILNHYKNNTNVGQYSPQDRVVIMFKNATAPSKEVQKAFDADVTAFITETPAEMKYVKNEQTVASYDKLVSLLKKNGYSQQTDAKGTPTGIWLKGDAVVDDGVKRGNVKDVGRIDFPESKPSSRGDIARAKRQEKKKAQQNKKKKAEAKKESANLDKKLNTEELTKEELDFISNMPAKEAIKLKTFGELRAAMIRQAVENNPKVIRKPKTDYTDEKPSSRRSRESKERKREKGMATGTLTGRKEPNRLDAETDQGAGIPDMADTKLLKPKNKNK